MMQPWLQPWAEKMRIREDVPLSSLTSFRIGGPADFAAYPADAGQLAGLREDCSRHGLPCLILGRGSNILACDEGYRGMVLLLGDALSQMRV